MNYCNNKVFSVINTSKPCKDLFGVVNIPKEPPEVSNCFVMAVNPMRCTRMQHKSKDLKSHDLRSAGKGCCKTLFKGHKLRLFAQKIKLRFVEKYI